MNAVPEDFSRGAVSGYSRWGLRSDEVDWLVKRSRELQEKS